MKIHAMKSVKSACSLFMLLFFLPGIAAAANSNLEVGLTYFYFDYKESLVLPNKSTEKGWLPGVYGSYEYNKKNDFYGKLFLSYAGGNITYDGATMAGTPLRFEDSRQRIFRFEGNFGFKKPSGDRLSLIPFIGYGYRYWKRGQIRSGDYEEDYSWSYIPVGLRLDYAASEKLSLGLSAQANLMFGGKMKAKGLTANDLDFDLGNKPGFYFEAPVRYSLTYNWFLSLTPWYEYSQIGESNVVGGFYEPSSRTHWYGVNIGAGYRF